MLPDVCYIIHNPVHVDRQPYIAKVSSAIKEIAPNCEIVMLWDKLGSELSIESLRHFLPQGRSQSHFQNACSLVLHHMKCLMHFVKGKTTYKTALVLEDDVFINDQTILANTFSQINLPFDSIYFGDGCQPDLYEGQPPQLILTPWSRCTEAIFYSLEGAMKILTHFYVGQSQNNCLPQLDFFFNNAYKVIDGYSNYHAHPAPMSQGTCKHGLSSTVN